MIYIVIILSTILISLFTLISLSILYTYFKKKVFNFIIVCTITGLFYDLIFTSYPFINTISFMLISFIIILNYRMFKYNIISSSLFNIILICIYRFISYILLVIINYINFNFKVLMQGIYSSIIINVIYSIILYIIVDKLSDILGKSRN